jgi:signal peptidase II
MHNLFEKIKHSSLIWLPICFLGLLLDQLSKYIAVETLTLGQTISVFPGFNFTLVHNYGSAFGFLNRGEGWNQVFLSGIAIVATILFIVWLWKIPKERSFEGLGIALLLSGAMGNLIDRLYYGYVIDFLDFYIADWHWYAFNLADSFICLGALLVMLQLFKKA